MTETWGHTPAGLILETELWQSGYRAIAGVDEAGRGAWAGPVVAAAVILPAAPAALRPLLGRVDDSKRLAPVERERLFDVIAAHALATGVGAVAADEIDRRGIVAATRAAMVQAIRALALVPDFLLLDYLTLPNLPQPQRGVPHGDSLSLSIAAASIIAKVTRDRWMIAQDVAHAGYGFARHKGYGTAEHLAALGRLGPCTLHRLSFRPVRDAEAASGHGTSFRNSEFEFQNPKSEIRNPKSERAGAVRRGRLGSRGEDLAVAYLARQGYALIARNWRTRAGELDIVAQDGEWLVFVEVRTRRRRGGMDEGPVAGDSTPTLGAPEESLTRHKQARLATMAETYLFESPWAGPWRIDVVALELWPDGSVARLNHLRDAVEGWP